MLADVIAHPHWFWLTLGGLLLVAEMLGTNGYLLWSGISAVLIGLLSWLVPLPWAWQGGLFALVTLVTAWLWYCWMQRREKKQLPNTLNQRGNQMIGRQLTLQTALVNGIGHIQTGDSSWRVQADSDLPAGCEVTVVAIEGITLRIRPRS
ncbi:NfeD family protein [Winslowiella iniecta]|uniref:Membrane protein n=1 Tax=Winslowiella iniecta TaxID=1560201 RepID=A0A0L7TG92_9GAMM|nr:NfeD family protein [Winslowiella iniecta]KOC89973.1 membrane protein [Winslowiella iniecta]KOC94377.1 membrane protein [Winslowiella iniecta]